MVIKTVGQLKEFIKDLDDDIIVISKTDNIMEIGNEYEKGAYVNIDTFITIKKECYDSFDYTDYTITIYRSDVNGVKCLAI